MLSYAIGLPTSPPQVTAVTPLSDTSFTVNWTISDPSYSYTVIWTNIHTGVMDSFTVPEDTNSYTVTGLSDNDNYNVSITAVGMCGMITSDSITVYGKCVHNYVRTSMIQCAYITFLCIGKVYLYAYVIISMYFWFTFSRSQ